MPESDSQACSKLPGVRGSVWTPVLRFRSVRGLSSSRWDVGPGALGWCCSSTRAEKAPPSSSVNETQAYPRSKMFPFHWCLSWGQRLCWWLLGIRGSHPCCWGLQTGLLVCFVSRKAVYRNGWWMEPGPLLGPSVAVLCTERDLVPRG